MAHNIEIKDIPRQKALFTTTICKQSELGEAFGRELPRVGAYLHSSGAGMAGAPFGRYSAWGDVDCTVDIGFPVQNEAPSSDGITFGEIGGYKAATTVHVGPYDRLHDAHMEVLEWLKSNGREMAGDPWEAYLNDPGSTDASKLETLIVWPIA